MSRSSRSYGYGGGTNPLTVPRSLTADPTTNSASRPAEASDSRARTPQRARLVGGRHDLALAVDRGEHVAAVVGHDQLDDVGERAQPVAERAQESSMPSPVTALMATDPGWSSTSRLASSGARSALLNTSSSGTARGVDLGEHVAHGVDLTLRVGGAGVDDVDQVVGAAGDLERALERLDEAVRQAADEADGVGEQHRLAAGQREAAGRRVERGEQAVLGQHAGVGQRVEQRRLAGVGVADDRDGGEPAAVALLALQVAGARRARSSSASRLLMRRMIRRRSTSSLVSPPPKRVPTPPRCWDSLALAPRRRRGRR